MMDEMIKTCNVIVWEISSNYEKQLVENRRRNLELRCNYKNCYNNKQLSNKKV